MIAAWIGPAIVAAFISALVTGLGWWVSERQALRRETLRRRERVVDMQTAILAEIRASRHRLTDLETDGAMVDRKMRSEDDYTPFVPRPVMPVIFGAIVSDLHILPTDVIDPVVIYYRQQAVIANLVDDIRSDRFASLDGSRQRALYRDFVSLMAQADLLGLEAEAAIRLSLNMKGGGSSAPRSAGERDGAAARDEASRSDS